MILGIAKSHAAHAADKIRQVVLPSTWNPLPVVSLPLHIGFVSGDFRAHVTAHLLQVTCFLLHTVTRVFVRPMRQILDVAI
jgi:hypothetical protein